jgi:L-aspartate oxidase
MASKASGVIGDSGTSGEAVSGAGAGPGWRGAKPGLGAGWRRDADVVVVGSGAAGISVALTAAARGLRVLVVTKDLVGGATPLAQGGLAAAIGAGDSTAAHASDTLTAGAGLCEPGVVDALAGGAPGAIDWLTGLGARLDTRELRLEGGHSAHRIVHSGDDATGAEVHRTLLAALLASGIEILDRTVALELLPRAGGTAGVLAGVIGAGGRLTPGVISGRAVVIATGGLGQAFGTTSNPAGATGDGITMAARAGAVLRDLEFVQFHPTVLWLPGASGQCPLVTEALRGAGAVLRDLDGTPLMAGQDPRGDLAPRDVVAARMAEVIAAGDAGHVWLDATGLGRELMENGFPTVTAACRKHGIDPVTAMIPVAPGAHYSCGGILADLDGQTSVPGLYAAGEAASTGVQGANRLASNSVTEAIIAGRRTGAAIADALAEGGAGEAGAGEGGAGEAAAGLAAEAGEADRAEPAGWGGWGGLAGQTTTPGGRLELAQAMSRYAGVLRDAGGLGRLGGVIGGPAAGAAGAAGAGDGAGAGAAGAAGEGGGYGMEEAASVPGGDVVDLDLEGMEAASLRLVSMLIATGARQRAESRGCHRRRDAPGTAAAPWHTLVRWDGQRAVVSEEPVMSGPVAARGALLVTSKEML